MTSKRFVAVVILAFATLRLILAATLSPGNDEAYYAQLAAHPDWSYFDHPPMLALVAGMGAAVGGEGSVLAVRAGFVLLFAATTWLMFRFTARLYGESAGVVAAVVMNATAYFGLAVGTMLLPDGPLFFFLILAMDRLAVALERPQRLGAWVACGGAWGGAMLSKYSAVFFAVGALGFLMSGREGRRALRTPGPYVAAAVGLVIFSPVIAWNASHDWISFAFQGGRAVGSQIRPLSLIASVAGQAAYVLPWIWVFLMVALWRAAKRRDHFDRFLLWQAMPPLAAFLVVALQREVLPHWSLIGLVPVFPLLGREWAEKRSTPRRLAIVTVFPVVLAVLLVSQSRWGWIPVKADPTSDGAGWGELLAEIDRRGLLDDRTTFLFTSTWYDSGQLAFANSGGLPVLCYAPRGGHNFDLWTDPAAMTGRSGLLVVVGENSTEPAMYDRWFERIEPAGTVVLSMGNRDPKTIRLYRCLRQTRPFPDPQIRPPAALAHRSPRGDGLAR